MSLLSDLSAARAFRPGVTFGDELAAVHVPFDELTGQRSYEHRLTQKALEGSLVLVVGHPGQGKSGLSSCALSSASGLLPVPVPVSVPHPDGAVGDELRGLVLRGLASQLAVLDPPAAELTQLAATGRRPRLKAPVRATVNLAILRVDLARQLDTAPLTGREQVDHVQQAFRILRNGGLLPVLVLDDTDKWASGDRLDHGRAFFDGAARALLDLDVPLVAHAHPQYFQGHAAPDWFDTTITVPQLSGGHIGRILERRVIVATEGVDGLGDVFEEDAVARLAEWFDGTSRQSIRSVISLAADALTEAVDATSDRIGVGAVESALALR